MPLRAFLTLFESYQACEHSREALIDLHMGFLLPRETLAQRQHTLIAEMQESHEPHPQALKIYNLTGYP